jgi:hypothetical protein
LKLVLFNELLPTIHANAPRRSESAVRYEKPALSSVDSKVEDKRQHVARIPHPRANPEECSLSLAALRLDGVALKSLRGLRC